MNWLKAALVVCVVFGLYKAITPKAPLPPDTAISPREVKSGLTGLFETEDRVCFNVPRLPQGRYFHPDRVANPVKPGGRRPYLDDLVEAGVLLHARNERTSRHADAKWVETYRVAPGYSKYYHDAGQRGRLCFARLSVDSVLSVQRVAPISSDHQVRLRFKVSDVADWVHRLPEGARADAQGWAAGPTRESSLVFCHNANLPHRQPSTNSGIISYGMNCAGVFVEDEPTRLIVTGPEPQDDQASWSYWISATIDGNGNGIER